MSRHGKHGSPEYLTWKSMKARCTNPNATGYKNWGGRGVKVCARWLDPENGFTNFYADMGQRPQGMSLDRHPDKNGNYEPGNCRWATTEEQQNNCRTNRFIEFNGHRMTVAQWTRHLGFAEATLRRRLRAGWSIERALTTPLMVQFSRSPMMRRWR